MQQIPQKKKISQSACKTHRLPFWKGLMNQKEIFFRFGSIHVGDGEGTRFWEDSWLGAAPLAYQYPNLYAIVNYKNVTMANAIKEDGLNISFRRNLVGDRWLSWLDLVERLMDIHLTDERDTFTWNLTESGQFTIRSLHT
jgi:hypothetical protein